MGQTAAAGAGNLKRPSPSAEAQTVETNLLKPVIVLLCNLYCMLNEVSISCYLHLRKKEKKKHINSDCVATIMSYTKKILSLNFHIMKCTAHLRE